MLLQERLDAASIHNEESGCKEWIRATNNSGYGILWFNGRPGKAHRAAWTAKFGGIPAGMHVLHRCDNRLCINPDHLFLGTHDDNMADKAAKNRQYRPDAKGEKNNMAKLTDEKVRKIRALVREGLSNRRVAEGFGVSIMTVSMIRNHRTWTHVDGVAP